jgi:hypothetical protein
VPYTKQGPFTNDGAPPINATRLNAMDDAIDQATDTAENHIVDSSAAHAASAISFTPAGSIAATTVQAAIVEAASEGGGGGATTAAAVSYAGSTDLVATNVEAALDELDAEKASATSVTDHINDTTDAHDASAISFVPTGTISATNVQTAVAEAAAEGAAPPFSDAGAIAKNSVDGSKQLRFDLTNVVSGALRILTMPNGNVNLTPDQAAATASLRTLGTGATQAAAGNHTHSGLAPVGGSTGQVLKKNSATNYDYAWAADETGAGGGSSAAADISIVDSGNNYVATNVEAALAEEADARQAHEADTVDAHDASAISYAGGTGMSATDVEAAIDELATEKVNVGAFVHYAIPFAFKGTLAVTTDADALRAAIVTTGTIVKVFAKVRQAPTTQSILIDLHLNGTTIWSTQASRVAIAAAANSGTQTTFNTTAVTEDDYLTCNIDQVGTGTAGADLTVFVKIRVAL